jgi:hypothetical protein
MKRDMDLIRKILLAIEAHPFYGKWNVPLDFGDFPEELVDYHLKLLSEANLIEAKVRIGSKRWVINGLTWAGHEFLDASRDDSRWESVKRLLLEKTGSHRRLSVWGQS